MTRSGEEVHRLRRSRGQAMYEFAIILPILLLVLLGMLEFGFAFNHNLTLEYSTREGARVGAALVNGGGPLGCGTGQSPNASTVDPLVVAAVERVLTASGSPINIAETPAITIRIYHVDSAGNAVAGHSATWTYGLGTKPTVDGQLLAFGVTSPPPASWNPCNRTYRSTLPAAPDSIGVSISYTYYLTTPLGDLLRLIGGGAGLGQLQMSDSTVMQFEPTNG